MRYRLLAILSAPCMVMACDAPKPAAFQASAVLPNAQGVTIESRVTFQGLDVGRVSQTHIVDGGIEIVMVFDRDDLRLRRGDQVRTYLPALLSSVSNIEIIPGPVDAPPLQAGEKLTAAAPVVSVSARELVDLLRAAATAPASQPSTQPTGRQ